jgi:YgiT-type zinc finger domain-containing protein
MLNQTNYDYQCEWCDGLVRERILPREVFRHAQGFVMLENVPTGVCDRCGRRYYSARVLHRVEDLALHRAKADRTEAIPVAQA